MRRSDRINRIQEILREKRTASTKYLCNVLETSESTVRRDVDFLISMNSNVRRVHGGVVLNDARTDLEYMFELKLKLNLDLKLHVADAAAKCIQDGDSIVLDSGTTCMFVAKALSHKKNLRVVTTDVKVAEELAKCENIESIIVGGVVRPGYFAVGDSLATEVLDHFVVDTAFLSADAIDAVNGVTNYSSFEVGVKKKVIQIAHRAILIADHTKFGKTSFYRIAPLSAFSLIVTNKEIDVDILQQITESGVAVKLV